MVIFRRQSMNYYKRPMHPFWTLGNYQIIFTPLSCFICFICSFVLIFYRCGTGAWTLEMATDYPFSKFTGIDVFPVYPSEIRPKNVEFEIANVLNGLPYEDGTFDFVFMRSMSLTFTPYEWEHIVVKELVRVVKPGGWIEIMECDPHLIGAGPVTNKFNKISRFLAFCIILLVFFFPTYSFDHY